MRPSVIAKRYYVNYYIAQVITNYLLKCYISVLDHARELN